MVRADVEGGGCAFVAGDDAVYGGGGSPESEESRRFRRFRRDRSRSVRSSSLDRGSEGCWIPVAGMLRALLFVPGSSQQSQPEAAWEGGKETV